MTENRRPAPTFSSLLARIQGAKSSLNNVETRVITADGRELVEHREEEGFTQARQVAVRPWGFVSDLSPDLQMAPVTDRFFLGGQDPAHDLCLLRSHGVTHVINLATNVDNHFESDLVYLKLELLDLPCTDLLSCLGRCLSFVEEALENNGRVFCHCNAGVSRSASVAIAYLMKTDQLPYRQAYDRVKAIRPVIRPNQGFVRQLQMFEVDLHFARHLPP